MKITMTRSRTSLASITLLVALLAACAEKKDTGDKVSDAIKSTGNKVGNAADKAIDKTEDAAHKVKDKVDGDSK